MSSYKQSFLNWIGHDPVVSQTASTSRKSLFALSRMLSPQLTYILYPLPPWLLGTIKNMARSGTGGVRGYVKSLFPFTNWILNYPSAPRWILGDLIAGESESISLETLLKR